MRSSPTRKRTIASEPEILILSPSEQQDLLRIESRIDSGLAAFFDVAYALLEIITLNSRKPSIVQYYQEAFGDTPIFDVRLVK